MNEIESTATSSASSIRGQFQHLTRSSSFIGKLGFVLATIFAYVILVKIGISILGWAMGSYSTSTELVGGMRSGKELIIFPQNPSISGSKPIFRSIDKSDGIEFTWSVWMFIDNLTYGAGKYKCVFYKGNDNIMSNGLNSPNNAPGVYITPDTNNLLIIMNTFNTIDEKIIISDVPMNKWMHLAIRCEGNKIDIYLNGTIAKSITLQDVPRQNYGDVYVGADGGFDGYISKLVYYTYAMNVSELKHIVSSGPSLSMDMTTLTNKDAAYLSGRWYVQQ